jgi:hypothetical protein
LDSNALESRQFGKSSWMRIAEEFWSDTSQTLYDSATSETAAGGKVTELTTTPMRRAHENITCPVLTSSAEDSPARTSATPESAPESTESAADCGASTRASFGSYDRATSSWKTSQLCFTGEWSEFSETWPRAGTMRSGKAYELPMLARRTEESESGLWPTPQAHDVRKRGNTEADHHYYPHDLANAVEMFPTPRVCAGLRSSGMNRTEFYRTFWPTPTAEDSQCKGNHLGPAGQLESLSLHAAVKLWPTPNATDGEKAPTIGGQLNPMWVEWLMGYPLGWTALEGSATPSSRKSQSTSPNKSYAARKRRSDQTTNSRRNVPE